MSNTERNTTGHEKTGRFAGFRAKLNAALDKLGFSRESVALNERTGHITGSRAAITAVCMLGLAACDPGSSSAPANDGTQPDDQDTSAQVEPDLTGSSDTSGTLDVDFSGNTDDTGPVEDGADPSTPPDTTPTETDTSTSDSEDTEPDPTDTEEGEDSEDPEDTTLPDPADTPHPGDPDTLDDTLPSAPILGGLPDTVILEEGQKFFEVPQITVDEHTVKVHIYCHNGGQQVGEVEEVVPGSTFSLQVSVSGIASLSSTFKFVPVNEAGIEGESTSVEVVSWEDLPTVSVGEDSEDPDSEPVLQVPLAASQVTFPVTLPVTAFNATHLNLYRVREGQEPELIQTDEIPEDGSTNDLNPEDDTVTFEVTLQEDSEGDGIAGTYEARPANDSGTEAPGISIEVEGVEAPTISNLEVDCSETGGFCGAGGLEYPLSFDVGNFDENTTYSVEVENLTGIGTTASVEPSEGLIDDIIDLETGKATVPFITGSTGSTFMKVTITLKGSGGEVSDSLELEQY